MKIGDYITIFNYGSTYPSYTDMFQRFNFIDQVRNHISQYGASNNSYWNNLPYKIIGMYNDLIGVECIADDQIIQFVINIDAIKLHHFSDELNHNIKLI